MNKRKILIVEDEAIAALALRMMLQSMGYQVCAVAPTGQEAVERARSDLPDAVLMDVRLKGAMTGVDAAQQIERERPVPVIFVTAYTGAELAGQDLLPDACFYLSKPVDERRLAEILGKLF